MLGAQGTGARRAADLLGYDSQLRALGAGAELDVLQLFGLWQGGRVEAPGAARTVGEVRERFIERLNAALLRPGMYGGELTAQTVLEDLSWLDGQDDLRPHIPETLRAAGAWSALGVRGVFMQMFGGDAVQHAAAASLVYADIAHARGYLRPQRVLTGQEYSWLRGRAREWTASADRTLPDLVDAFGLPSLWRPKYNRLYPVSVGYVSAHGGDPLVAFDFWQDTDGTKPPWRPRLGPEPMLRNVRWRTDIFADGFTFSPIGTTMLAARDRSQD